MMERRRELQRSKDEWNQGIIAGHRVSSTWPRYLLNMVA